MDKRSNDIDTQMRTHYLILRHIQSHLMPIHSRLFLAMRNIHESTGDDGREGQVRIACWAGAVKLCVLARGSTLQL